MRKLLHDEIERPSHGQLAQLQSHPIVVLLDDIRSLLNVGSIFRTSDAARIQRIYLGGITGTPMHPGMHKTALGAQDVVPWEHHREPLPVVRSLREQGYTIAALEITDTPTLIGDLSMDQFPLCLIVGNEVNGIAINLLDECDLALEIPQYGVKQSMNVAVAYGVAVMGLVEQYRKNHSFSEGSMPAYQDRTKS